MVNIDSKLAALPVGEVLYYDVWGDLCPFEAAVERYRKAHGGRWQVRKKVAFSEACEIWITRLAPDYPTGRVKWPFKDLAVGETARIEDAPVTKAVAALRQLKHTHSMEFDYKDVRVGGGRRELRVTRTR